MELTKKSQETIIKLQNKSNDNGWKAKHRMPNINSISKLLTELNINHSIDGMTRRTSTGGLHSPIHTTTGTKNGNILTIKNTDIKIDTTQIGWGHRWGTQQHTCQEILDFINK